MFVLVVLFSLFLSSSAFAQSKFTPSPATTYKALAEGKIHEALASYEAQAREAEGNAARGIAPQKHWTMAVHAYAEAALAARLNEQYQVALRYSAKALELAEKTTDRRLRIRALFQNVLIYREIGQFDKSGEFLQKCFEVLEGFSAGESIRLYWESILRHAQGEEMLRSRDFERATEVLARSTALDQILSSRVDGMGPSERYRVNIRPLAIYHLHSLVRAYQGAGKADEALKSIQQAIELMKTSGITHASEGDFYVSLGEIHRDKNEPDEALANFRYALALAEKHERPFGIRLAAIRIGDLLVHRGQPGEALPYYEKAIAQVESGRSAIESGEYRQSFFELELEAYVKMIDALWTAGDPKKAFDYNELARARAFLDLLGSRKITGEAGGLSSKDPRSNALKTVTPLKLKEVQALLRPNQSLMQYFVGPDAMFLWLVEREQVNAWRVSVAQAELEDLVEALRRAVAELKPVSEYKRHANHIYELLIGPALPHIRGTHMIVVPHGVLHSLPFQLLQSADGRYLIQDYAISYPSSASLLRFTAGGRRRSDARLLAFGNPNLGDPHRELPFAEQEVKRIAALYPRSMLLIKDQATERKLKGLSSRFDIIHLAAHAELRRNDPLSSAILLSRQGQEDGRLEIKEVLQMSLKADLVVLSGCETGLGELSRSDELTGLTRAFIYAGAPSVLATLWKVADDSTADLMVSFYRNLKTMPKAEALRQAQLKMIQRNGSRELLARRGVGGIAPLGKGPAPESFSSTSLSTSHPYFWAPFVLVGNGQ